MSKRSSPIIIGIFLVINSILAAWLVLFNLKEQLVGLIENSSSNVPENVWEMIIIFNGLTFIGD